MKKIVLTFGIISGLICGGMFFLNIPEDGKIDFSHGALYGYVTMFIALSSIFFAVKQYRDQYNDGIIKFGKAFMIGISISLVASVVYIICWEIYFTNYASDFGAQYVDYLQEQMSSEGLSADAIETKIASQREMMRNYQNSMSIRMGMTFLEIFPVGLLISILSAILFGVILKNKNIQNSETLIK